MQNLTFIMELQKKRLSISCSYKKTDAYGSERKAFSTPSYHDPCLCIPQNAWYVAPDLTFTISATCMKPLKCVKLLFKKIQVFQKTSRSEGEASVISEGGLMFKGYGCCTVSKSCV